jgi:hypothetical protein
MLQLFHSWEEGQRMTNRRTARRSGIFIAVSQLSDLSGEWFANPKPIARSFPRDAAEQRT